VKEVAPLVHVVDDDESFLRAVSRLLQAAGFAVQTFPGGPELLSRISSATRGCVLADMQMPALNGLELQDALAAAGVRMPLIFLTGHGDIPSTVRAMRQGALDFLEKLAPKEQLISAVRVALERDAAAQVTRDRHEAVRARFGALSKRELEVLSHVVRGRMNKQIAADLGIHERTVKAHRTAITTKAGAHSVAELTTLARDAHLFESATPGLARTK
jgi:two-component system response regulator FixJ